MAVVYRYPLTTTFGAGTDALGTFDAVRSMQANGTNPGGAASPNGNGTQISIVDGWARMRMQEGETPFPPALSNNRSEITGLDEAVPSRRLYRWESLLDNWPVTPGNLFVTMQMHANHDDGAFAENVLMMTDGAVLGMYLPSIEPPAQGAASKLVAQMRLQQSGTIYRHALLVDWARSKAGSITWMVNGRVLFNSRAIGNDYNYAIGPYLKLGVYTNGAKAPGWGFREQYIRNVIVTDGLDGKSWTELIGDIPRPLPFSVL